MQALLSFNTSIGTLDEILLDSYRPFPSGYQRFMGSSADRGEDIPYVAKADKLQTLDVYTPAKDGKLPVVYWIHGGGWQTGDKGEVASKPKAFTRGMVLCPSQLPIAPASGMKTIVEDVAAGMRWVKDNVSQYGGDPKKCLSWALRRRTIGSPSLH